MCPLTSLFIYAAIRFFPRWAYRRFFVADGNFKADHVRQKHSDAEYWLWDGSGMMANRQKYAEFLRDAIERKTVELLCTLAQQLINASCRVLLVKTISVLWNSHCLPLKLVMSQA